MPIAIPQREPCPFCENLAGRHPCAFIAQHDLYSSFVNPRQFEKGTLLVIPNRHAPTLLDLHSDELTAMFLHAQNLIRALNKAFSPDGYNVYQNNGIAAGQSVPHYHLHIVPRYVHDVSARIFTEHSVEKTAFAKRVEIAEAVKRCLGE
jgi:histidine triad (HIT) family protein